MKSFEIEDFRIMIGQNIGLQYLIPLAIEELKSNILAEGDFYEGDLLKNVLSSDKNYWLQEKENGEVVCDLFKKNIQKLKEFDTAEEIRQGWFDGFEGFKRMFK